MNMERRQVLVVDDEPDIRELLAITLGRMGLDCHTVATLTHARQRLAGGGFDLCLTDMRLPDGDGLDLLAWAQANRAQLPIAVITAHGDMQTAIEALKRGAFDFVTKPVDLDVLRRLVGTAARLAERRAPAPFALVGESPAMKAVLALVAKVARSQAPVLVTGESGTGKERIARLIHAESPRSDRPFVAVNCGAIPAELIESELFGHRKGSFTGATADSPGLFGAAQGGTLFLDEIAELPLAMQVKLLRAIQERAVRPVGATTEVPVDCRIISATHARLDERVQAGQFRQDLYYRINVIELPVPPLRERGEDIHLLVDYTLGRLSALNGTGVPELTPAARAALAAWPFPGNVRELENILERAVTLAEGTLIDVADLRLPPLRGAAGAGPEAAVAEAGLDQALEGVERERILAALRETRWNRTAAARLLGITFRALRYRMEKLGLGGE